ncbi:MAG: hypothetical protein K2M48_03390, partial [Clostridiales bacterium]|nr:hypothetical protein [Clostridiales bacterium]
MLGRSSDLYDLLTVISTADDVRNSVPSNVSTKTPNGEYFEVETFDVYIDAADSVWFKGRYEALSKDGKIVNGFTTKSITVTIDGSDVTKNYIVVTGLKITLKNRTHDRYLYATAKVSDLEGLTKDVRIAIKTDNRTPQATESAKVAQIDYKYNGKTVSTEYTAATSTITYNIPLKSSIIITPYDILTDADMKASGAAYPESGFTLNGFSGAYIKTETSGTLTNAQVDGTLSIKGIANSSNLKSKGGNKADGVDYSDTASTAYLGSNGALVKSLQSIGAQKNSGIRAFANSVVSPTNTFAAGTTGSTGTDRLFFARTNDSSNLDGFSFNPYNPAQGTSYGTLADPVMENESFISINSGSTLELYGVSYDLDFFVITAMSKTPSGIKPKLTFTVRDRTGAGAAGVAAGVKQITVVINIINSTPYLNDATRPGYTEENPENASYVYTLATSALTDNSIRYPTIELMATSILKDNEDDPVAFFLGGSTDVSVIDGSGSDKDIYNNPYRGSYIRVVITADKMTITALNSTQNITSGLFIVFYATDYRSNSPSEQSTLKIQIEVLNSSPAENRGADGLEFVNLFDPMNPAALVGSWTVESFSEADKTTPRFFASNAQTVEYLKGGKYTAIKNIGGDQVKVIVSDTDALQGSVLAPNYTDGGPTKYITIPNGTSKANYKNYVPLISKQAASASNPVAVTIG